MDLTDDNRDPALQNALDTILVRRDPSYAVTVVDITDPAQRRLGGGSGGSLAAPGQRRQARRDDRFFRQPAARFPGSRRAGDGAQGEGRGGRGLGGRRPAHHPSLRPRDRSQPVFHHRRRRAVQPRRVDRPHDLGVGQLGGIHGVEGSHAPAPLRVRVPAHRRAGARVLQGHAEEPAHRAVARGHQRSAGRRRDRSRRVSSGHHVHQGGTGQGARHELLRHAAGARPDPAPNRTGADGRRLVEPRDEAVPLHDQEAVPLCLRAGARRGRRLLQEWFVLQVHARRGIHLRASTAATSRTS